MKNSSLFKSTVLISNIKELDKLKAGQWVKFDSGSRGQYLGKTESGNIIIRYQSGKFGKPKHTNGNHLLRQYAKENGSL